MVEQCNIRWVDVLSGEPPCLSGDETCPHRLQLCLEQCRTAKDATPWVALFHEVDKGSVFEAQLPALWQELIEPTGRHDVRIVTACVLAMRHFAELCDGFLSASEGIDLSSRTELFNAIASTWGRSSGPTGDLLERQICHGLTGASTRAVAVRWLSRQTSPPSDDDFYDTHVQGLLGACSDRDATTAKLALQTVQRLIVEPVDQQRLARKIDKWLRSQLQSTADAEILHGLRLIRALAGVAKHDIAAVLDDQDLLSDLALEAQSSDAILEATLTALASSSSDRARQRSSAAFLQLVDSASCPAVVIAAALLRCKTGEMTSDAPLERLALPLRAIEKSLADSPSPGPALALLSQLSRHVGCRLFVSDKLVPLIARLPAERLDDEAAFSTLLILKNLTEMPPAPGTEEYSMQTLSQKAAEAEGRQVLREDAEDVQARIRSLATGGAIDLLSRCSIGQTSTKAQLGASILASMAISAGASTELARSGVVGQLVALSQRYRQDQEVMTVVCETLAALLPSLDPSLVFGGRTSSLDAAVVLMRSLEADSLATEIVKLRSLMSLTNLCSLGHDTCRLIANHWDDIRLASQDEQPPIARAATELICNLCADAAGARLFLDSDRPGAEGDFRLLCHLADSRDVATRRAAAGALAMLSDLTVSVSVFSRAADALVKLFLEEDEAEVQHRLAVVLVNVFSQAKILDADQTECVRCRAESIRAAGHVDTDLDQTLEQLTSII